MTWFKVDDSFHSHPKVLSSSLEALGLWALAGTWSAANLTDGFVSVQVLSRLHPDSAPLAEELVTVGLWRRAKGGYQFHDWTDYQPTKAMVEAERRKWAEKKAKQRAAKTFDEDQMSPGDTPGDSKGESSGESQGSRSRSRVPKGTSTSASPTKRQKKSEPQRDDVDELCKKLADWVVKNGSKPPKVGETWKREARLLLDEDKRELDKALALIDWCQTSKFWRKNILSMGKFREKYDQVRLDAVAEWEKGKTSKFETPKSSAPEAVPDDQKCDDHRRPLPCSLCKTERAGRRNAA